MGDPGDLMGLEVGELSSMELSGLGRLVTRETQAREGGGSRKVDFAVSLESTKSRVDLDGGVGLGVWVGTGNLGRRCVGMPENSCQDRGVVGDNYHPGVQELVSGDRPSGKEQ